MDIDRILTVVPSQKTKRATTTSLAGRLPSVAVVDDDQRSRSSMRDWLVGDRWDVEDFANCEALLADDLPYRHDCVLVRAGMGGMGGLGFLMFLRAQGRAMPAVIITGCRDVAMAILVMRAGAADILEPACVASEVMSSVVRCLQSTLALSSWDQDRADAADRFVTLTTRQRQIMRRVLAGEPSKIIAADLGISRRTVETHRSAIMRKTGSRSLPALTRFAMATSAPI